MTTKVRPMAGSPNAHREYRKQVMTEQLAVLAMSESMYEAVRTAKENGLTDWRIREILLDYAGGPR